MGHCLFFSLIFAAVLGQANGRSKCRPGAPEAERVEAWHASGNTWPPTWQTESPGFKKLMDDREHDLRQIPGGRERWENYMQYTQSRLVPSFTERGFDVVDIPSELYATLRERLLPSIEKLDSLRDEGNIGVIYNSQGKLPKFAYLNGADREVHHQLLPYHEAWAGGIKLIPTSAYGVRLYLNGSSLVMHYDKVHTHVISSIVHIAHEGEPWPLDIEAHNTGELHSVVLQPGQMLFYESAKCLHGRMQEFNGRYYASIFMHYQPADKALWDYNVDDVIANVPPHWNANLTTDKGSRWAGQALTIDSRLAAGAPPRDYSV
jgi:hypothetical protein